MQESPAFIIPCLLLAEKWEQTGITEKILLIMFLIHYFQRYRKLAPKDPELTLSKSVRWRCLQELADHFFEGVSRHPIT